MIDLRPAITTALLVAAFAAPSLAQDAEAPIATNSKTESLTAETAAAPVGAREVISTPAAPLGPPMTTEQKIANVLSGSWSADEADEPAIMGPRKIHGGGSVAVGSDGYRAASVYGVFPVGEKGTLGVAYSQAQGGGVYGYGYDGFGGAPYGGYGVGRNGVSRSLALSFDYDARTATPQECATAFREAAGPGEPRPMTDMRERSRCGASRE